MRGAAGVRVDRRRETRLQEMGITLAHALEFKGRRLEFDVDRNPMALLELYVADPPAHALAPAARGRINLPILWLRLTFLPIRSAA